jgi:4-diphosphocytidyl-2-C-methyl-D-erythritol kinase
MPSLTRKAPAKINLHLRVGARRTDGYHSIETVFQEISLHDTLRFETTPGPLELTISSSAKLLRQARLSSGPDNLVIRALQLLRNRLGTKEGMRVHLTKRIPMGAGLGGGSSDAAAALWGGWLLWKKKSTKQPRRVPKMLLECARKLGADVSFFLRGGKARGEGIGERLTPLKKDRRRWLVLIYPRVHVSTKEAYRLLDRHSDGSRNPGWTSASAGATNSFESVILPRYPKIAAAKWALLKMGCAPVMMSGSGSAVFGFARNHRQAKTILKKMKSHPADIFLAHTV